MLVQGDALITMTLECQDIKKLLILKRLLAFGKMNMELLEEIALRRAVQIALSRGREKTRSFKAEMNRA